MEFIEREETKFRTWEGLRGRGGGLFIEIEEISLDFLL